MKIASFYTKRTLTKHFCPRYEISGLWGSDLCDFYYLVKKLIIESCCGRNNYASVILSNILVVNIVLCYVQGFLARLNKMTYY